MMKLVVLVACVAASLAAYTTHDHHNHGHNSHHHGKNHHGGYNHLGNNHGGHNKGYDHDYHKPAHYGFEYGVSEPYNGANFGHAEQRDGHVTKGSYYVQLPDGRTQKVAYTADKYGYHPVITYEGHASFPEHQKGGYGQQHKGYGQHHKGGYSH